VTTTTNQTIGERRDFLRTAAAAAAGLTLAGCKAAGGEDKEGKEEHGEAEVTPGEDLMQEHGVLERILLIYDEGARRLERSERFDLKILTDAAAIVERFVENYHEKLEEQFVFPRLQAANREVELVAVLLRQHERGREITDQILRRADASASAGLALSLRSFVTMYRPHMAREDTVLFPAFREVVGRAGYGELGEQFEDREHELFGERGFENTVTEVARLETALGIADLARFTP
jgi:hemerythrin-like domain-containing protein